MSVWLELILKKKIIKILEMLFKNYNKLLYQIFV